MQSMEKKHREYGANDKLQATMSRAPRTNRQQLHVSKYPRRNAKNKIAMEVSGDKEERKEGRKGRKPGRKSSKIDMKAKLERSRQSARECRARKKIRYQYLDELVADREKAVLQLRKELEMYTQWARALDEGHIPDSALKMVEEEKRKERLSDRDTNRQ